MWLAAEKANRRFLNNWEQLIVYFKTTKINDEILIEFVYNVDD